MQNKKNNLFENLQCFIEERLDESYTNLIHTKEYEKINQDYFKVFNKLKRVLKNDISLLENYEELKSILYYMQLKQAYLKGFQDSNIILNKTIILK